LFWVMMNFLAILETPLVVVGIAYEVSLAHPANKSNTRPRPRPRNPR
jgi:hypothetical protein